MARIISAFTQFFDDNGDPLINGFLQFLESGTNNTDKDTFKDINQSIANTNPVALDGAGRCPNVFGDGAYNVISFTSALVQIQQFDPVGGTSSGFFADWNASTIYDVLGTAIGSNGLYYRSLTADNQNNDPTSSSSSWEEVRFTAVYNAAVTYSIGDIVADSNGHLYRSIVDSNLNNTPADNIDKWGDPTNFPSRTLIASATASASSSIDFTNVFTADFKRYEVEFDEVVPGNTSKELLLSSTIDSGSNWVLEGLISPPISNVAVDNGTSGSVAVFGAAVPRFTAFKTNAVNISAETELDTVFSELTSGVVDGVRFTINGGSNIVTGSFRVFGINQ